MLLLDPIEQHMRGRASPLRRPFDVKGTGPWAKFVAGSRTTPFGRFRDKAYGRVDQPGIPLALTWSEAPHRFPQNAVDIAISCIAKPVRHCWLASLFFGLFLLGQNVHNGASGNSAGAYIVEADGDFAPQRSEERRVGKECRSR